MRSKGNAPTAAQKRWMESVRGLGSVISGEPAVIHHPVGATGKHNKVHIGHWWIIPLTDAEHRALHNGEHIWDGIFPVQSRKQFEIFIYFDAVSTVMYGHPDHPAKLKAGINEAIQGYHK